MIRNGLLLLLLAAASTAGAQSLPAWTVGDTPALDIGDEASVQTQFNGVTGVLRMPRGEIVVANGMSQELRVFSPAGAYLRTLSVAGTGQGSIRALNRLWRSGDTIIAAEIVGGETNLHLYTTTRHLSSHPIGRSNAGSLVPVERFPDGRVVVRGSRRSPRSISSAAPFVDSALVGVVSLDNLMPAWIGTLVSEMILIPGFGGGRGRAPNIVPYAFGRTHAYAVSGDRLWIGDSETAVVEQYDSRGRRLATVQLPIAQRPLDTLLLRRQRATVLNDAMNWNDRARLDASYAVPLPRFAPRFTRFVPGPNGEMWVELFRESPDAERVYVVYDTAGKARASVTMPRGTTLFEAGQDYLLAVRRDQEGLEHVMQYRLTRR